MEAKQHMLDGIGFLNEGKWEEALGHFDRAIALREGMRWRESVECAWLLAAAWINRSDALRLLGRTKEGIASLDEAIQAMAHVPLAENAFYVDRLILAWINRGTACGEAGRNEEALEGFKRAEETLEAAGGTGNRGRKLLASMTRTNRARVLLGMERVIEGWEEALAGLNGVRELEPATDLAEISITARGVLCHAMALLLDEPRGAELPGEWIATATDLVEEALALVRSSGKPSAWQANLVRYGATIYRVCQPHFLGEFVREWGILAWEEDLKRDLSWQLAMAKRDLAESLLGRSHDTGTAARAAKILSSLQKAEGELLGTA